MAKRTFRFQVSRFNTIVSVLAFVLAAATFHPAAMTAQLPAGTPLYNVNSKWVTDHGSQVFNVLAYGAKCDGTTDDAAAIQAAINAANPNFSTTNGPANTVLIPGGCAIGSTITVKGILTGTGRGGNGTAGGSYLHWIGASGSPMLLINSWFDSVRDLHLEGNSSAPPSEAIQISTYPSTSTNYGDMGSIRDVTIGYIGGDPDSGVQFVNGITWKGTTGGDSFWLSNININKCSGNGINNPNPNASDHHIENLYVSGCAVGWYGSGQSIYGTNWEFYGNGIDLQLLNGADLNIHGFVGTGGATQMLVNAGRIVIDGGSWMPPDGSSNLNIIDNSAYGDTTIRNFHLLNNPNQTGTETILQCTYSSGTNHNGTYLGLLDVTGFSLGMISCGANWSYGNGTDAGVVEFRPRNPTGTFHTDAYNIEGKYTGYPFNSQRHDYEYQYDFWGGPIELIQSAAFWAPACSPTGSGSTSYGYRVTGVTPSLLGAVGTPVNFGGETAPSPEVTCSNASSLSGSNYNTLTLYAQPGFSSFNIYCRTPGAEQLCGNVPLTGSSNRAYYWVDNGSATPSGAMPSTNTTGRFIGGTLNADYSWTKNLDIGADGHGWFTSLRSTNGFNDATNCASASGSCSSATAGAVTIAASASSVTVSTTAITANSNIALTFDSSLGSRLSVTCNTTPQQPYVSARTAGTSFTISVPSAFTTNPGCISWLIRD